MISDYNCNFSKKYLSCPTASLLRTFPMISTIVVKLLYYLSQCIFYIGVYTHPLSPALHRKHNNLKEQDTEDFFHRCRLAEPTAFVACFFFCFCILLFENAVGYLLYLSAEHVVNHGFIINLLSFYDRNNG